MALGSGDPYRDRGTPAPDFVITRRWFSAKTVFLLFFCIFWDGFLVMWYSLATRGHGTPIFAFLFPLLHVGAGAYLTWQALCGLINRTRIEVHLRELRIKHGPLPWPGNRRLPVSSLKQLFSEERVSRSGNRNSTTRRYHLNAVLRDGRKVTLLDNLDEADQALYLEQEIERRLGIVDAPVAGELPR
jgi:hypothetical protein